ncbi:hypothetical protein JCM8547_008781 [Rhodosporidiobolus lusitaniae]
MSAPASTLKPVEAIPTLDSTDCLETRSVQFEWKVSNLRQLFEQTKGDVKSKCIKSPFFDQSRWQVFLYPNSGHEQQVSLYLSCEPTAFEKERALAEQAAAALASSYATPTPSSTFPSGDDSKKEKEKLPWRRDGRFKFTFTVRSVDRRVVVKTMEAEDTHEFTWKERNWGYASMISRREAYYGNPHARSADAFLITCAIVSSPSLPTPSPSLHLTSVPRTLVSAYASLFDDPDYSDVVFRIRPENSAVGKNGRLREKRLFAAKKVLAGRSEYFETMFSSGFSEGMLPAPSSSSKGETRAARTSTLSELDDEGELSFDDEDDEEEDESSGSSGETDEGWDEDDDSQIDESEEEEEVEEYDDASELDQHYPTLSPDVSTAPTPAPPAHSPPPHSNAPTPAPVSPELARTPHSSSSSNAPSTAFTASLPRSRTSSASLTDDEDRADEGFRSSAPSLPEEDTASPNHAAEETSPSTPPTSSHFPFPTASPSPSRTASRRSSKFVDAPSSAPASPVKPSISNSASAALVRAVSSSTAVTVKRDSGGKGEKKKVRKPKRGEGRARFEVVVTDAAYSTYRSLLHYLYTDSISFSPLSSSFYVAKDAASSASLPFPYPSRRAYLLAHSPLTVSGPGGGGVPPCSSKAVYRLADKMGLAELKQRAYEHVVSSLTSENIVYEVFGSFSQRFDEIRKVEMGVLLANWSTVRSSPQLSKVLSYLRTNRFPGFEDVWIELVQQLEVRPTPAPVATAAGGLVGGQAGERGEGEEGGGGRGGV